MLNASPAHRVVSPHYSQLIHFDSFFQLIRNLDDNIQYVFRAYDVRGGLYHGSETVIPGRQLKNKDYLRGLTTHFTHTYRVYTPDGKAELARYLPTGVGGRVTQIIH